MVKRTSNIRILLALALIILGIYFIPQATAKYSGSHTWEANTTWGVEAIRCNKCHIYITDEFDAGNPDLEVYSSHLTAASNTNYVSPNKIINISNRYITMTNICLMCHEGELDSQTVGGTHTKITVRVCTDSDCHGDQSGTTSCTVWGGPGAGANSTCNVTGRLNNSADAHSNFYRPLTTRNSTYANEDGGFYDEGFYACMACHTHVGMDLELERPNQLILNMTYNGTPTSQSWKLRGEGVTVNVSSMNISIGGKSPGSVWE